MSLSKYNEINKLSQVRIIPAIGYNSNSMIVFDMIKKGDIIPAVNQATAIMLKKSAKDLRCANVYCLIKEIMS
ncbi:MAG: hypothetical protein UV61_C0012G0004 [Candidatus Gottesmanbacteria bacterium GW2011_GWB1_43_11]|uniref:Uncharacterized protein n=1 Tax=Candidatus Gottesmanbacteria bacterium GW2011_GWB1_43_11 TaxID=1618446 RepID=A0A0G1CL36_9BACT|nr:MAG: hypothetical protein UV04_C0024G0014 [Candidatus Gottesmanbacteria bacterium GW2011_GWA2_42_16]KKS53638.1 MAG: hypothetical protein UV17_C0033G0013 [Candidatus Gottesmanbacteria bacterium GW2011_GWA1_42_26]KKS81078.1 MAG: hypothetical protein UV55_C0022G0004 [Candidatus Gottesmanbacteria bacterium GW2011_GWC1_43_10]KKS86177.1 MAG: hypothetical protein UV61_C0012G0004 [Candidatus Gottesmanbacteria bacterium GW2011_GWB1_43_11]